MAESKPTTVTIPLNLTAEEAQDFAVLCRRINLDHLRRLAWRGAGDTEITVGRWAVIFGRISEELARAGYTHTGTREGE